MSRWTIDLPIQFGSRCFVLTAHVVESNSDSTSSVPCLIGRNEMARLDVYYAVRDGKYIVPGPGGLKIQCSPGTETFQMRQFNKEGHGYLRADDPVVPGSAKKKFGGRTVHLVRNNGSCHCCDGKQIFFSDADE